MEAQARAARLPCRRGAVGRSSRTGSTRLSKPPQESPIPNSVERRRAWPRRPRPAGLQHDAEQARRAPGSRASRSRGPDRSRSAGCSTRATSGRAASQRAIASAGCSCSRRRTAMVRRPRSARNTSSGPAQMAKASKVARSALPAALVGRDQAEQQIGMAAQVFGAGLDRDVDAARVRREEQRRRPGVVHQHDRAARDARPRRSPECPASRSVSEPGASVKTARGVRLEQLARCRRRSADRSRSSRRRSASAPCRRNSASAGRRESVTSRWSPA